MYKHFRTLCVCEFWPALIAAGASLVGGALSNEANAAQGADNRQFQSDQAGANRDFNAQQAQLSRDFNSAEAAKQRQWEQEMYESRYERTAMDLKRAGLSPMLAYSSAPPGPPGGASASAGSASYGGGVGAQAEQRDVISPAVQSGLAAMRMEQELKNMEASRRNIDADTANKEDTGPKIRADAQVSEETIRLVREQAEKVLQEVVNLKQAKEKLWYETKSSEYYAIRAKYETMLTMFEYKNMSPERARKLKAEAELLELEIPKALNEAAMEDTDFKRYVSPFLKDANVLFNSGAQATSLGLRARMNRYIIHGR